MIKTTTKTKTKKKTIVLACVAVVLLGSLAAVSARKLFQSGVQLKLDKYVVTPGQEIEIDLEVDCPKNLAFGKGWIRGKYFGMAIYKDFNFDISQHDWYSDENYYDITCIKNKSSKKRSISIPPDAKPGIYSFEAVAYKRKKGVIFYDNEVMDKDLIKKDKVKEFGRDKVRFKVTEAIEKPTLEVSLSDNVYVGQNTEVEVVAKDKDGLSEIALSWDGGKDVNFECSPKENICFHVFKIMPSKEKTYKIKVTAWDSGIDGKSREKITVEKELISTASE